MPQQLTNLLNSVKTAPSWIWQVVGCLLLVGGGFYGGLRYSDAKLHTQETKYQDQIKKLDQDITTKEASLQQHVQVEVAKTKIALDYQAQANQAKVKADSAEKRYRVLEAKLKVTTSKLPGLPVIPPTAQDIATAGDEVIANKNQQITGLTLGLSNVFDAKAAADLALKDAQAENVDHVTKEAFQDKLNSDLSKDLASQKRRKWLYFGGGIILGGLAGHAIAK